MGSALSRAPHSLMSWLIVLLVLGASQIAFKRWQANVSYRVSLTLPIVANTFEIAADEAVPADTREILGERTAPLVALGFERLGFLCAPGALSGVTQTRTVLCHPTEHAFAVIGFGLLGHDLGISVDLVTLLGPSRAGQLTAECNRDRVALFGHQPPLGRPRMARRPVMAPRANHRPPSLR